MQRSIPYVICWRHGANFGARPSKQAAETITNQIEMAGPILYSTNPWISHEIAVKYLKGVHFAWVSEHFDATAATPGTGAAAIAPSSNPKLIYDNLWRDVDGEDTHSFLIKGYKKKFRILSAQWLANGAINQQQKDDIVATVESKSWKIWRPVLFTIAKDLIDPARIKSVNHKNRAAYGPELQIVDLLPNEFDVIEIRR
ncbi:hypothetical protein [Variovorax sp. J22R115]|uniref:hypothetical protein n=1 Tax=Variovorax sp. J22R115 TaxID=3053509 RepID=UPI0025766988|nr:hypothetical protein [Variovorax sp. J22R115]MDM0051402.1 hypothetical protein [Variovorax sp. J22R115]